MPFQVGIGLRADVDWFGYIVRYLTLTATAFAVTWMIARTLTLEP